MTIRVGVLGAAGRMGQTVCRAVHDDPELELAGLADPAGEGNILFGLDIHPTPDPLANQVDVVVDFTRLDAALSNLSWAASSGIHAVVGTSGFSDADYAMCRQEFTKSNCLIAPNFAIGAVLMMRFAELAAPWFETAEIVELHHDQKLDAPSGTAIHTAERMAEASSEWGDDPTRSEVLPGARGGAGPEGIRVHSVRLRGLVAHQEVLLGTAGQCLTIRHDSYDRSSFMPGVLLAVKQIRNLPGLTIGLDPLLAL